MNPISFLADIMLSVLNIFYAVTNNYGTAIILLTVAINVLLYPLTYQSVKSMKTLQKIQPMLKEIQAKHKESPEKIQKETMELYKNEKVNPLGGCLPILLKMPFFLALFFALQSQEFAKIASDPGANASFLWIENLSMASTAGWMSYIMPALIAISTYLTQTTMPGAAQQSKAMTMFMPAFIAVISYRFPAGVQIYWIASNLITMAQQAYINNKIKDVSRETKTGGA